MSKSKQGEVSGFLEREVREAIQIYAAEVSDRELGEALRKAAYGMARSAAFRIGHYPYRFLELADIMEWKRTRSRR